MSDQIPGYWPACGTYGAVLLLHAGKELNILLLVLLSCVNWNKRYPHSPQKQTKTPRHATPRHTTALHCTTLHYTTLTLHYTTLHTTLHYTTLLTLLHCTALHCTALHYTTLTLHYTYTTALHCTALHCTMLLYYTTLHYTTPLHHTDSTPHLWLTCPVWWMSGNRFVYDKENQQIWLCNFLAGIHCQEDLWCLSDLPQLSESGTLQ